MMSTFPASLLILNGKGANEPQLREAVNLLRDEGIDIHVRVTWEKGDAARFIDEALQLNVETVIAGGGDGTINEVATALVERGGKMALGILPLGTANDFATSVGIPQDLASALKLAIVGRDVPIDIARVNDKTGFINMATGGFGTRITHRNAGKTQGRARRCLLFNPRSDAHGYTEAGPLRDPRGELSLAGRCAGHRHRQRSPGRRRPAAVSGGVD